MINIPPTLPASSQITVRRQPATRRIVPSAAADRRTAQALDRRLNDRRRNRNIAQKIMDRRAGPERRRSSIDLSI